MLKRAGGPGRRAPWTQVDFPVLWSRIRTSGPRAALIAVLAVCASRLILRDRAPARLGRPPAAAGNSWRKARSKRHEADRCRREGELERAVQVYREVISDPLVRDDDRCHALVWMARLRLERGELAALEDIRELVAQPLAPAHVARLALALRRCADTGDDRFRQRSDELAERCIGVLDACARTSDQTGERARSWLRRLGASSIE